MSAPSPVNGVGRGAVPAAGDVAALPLGGPEDTAELRVVADVGRDLMPLQPGASRRALEPVADAVLVDVTVRGRTVLPGAWLRRSDAQTLTISGYRPLTEADVRMPAVVIGHGAGAELAWGQTLWPLHLDEQIAVPETCRPSVHGLARLRRLVLVALGRRDEVALTLWREPGFEIPWHDVRMAPYARWWFELAQVPPGMRYADAARRQGLDPCALLSDGIAPGR